MGRGDRFQEHSFTNAVMEKPISDEDWEVAMGTRCPDCKHFWAECICNEDKQ